MSQPPYQPNNMQQSFNPLNQGTPNQQFYQPYKAVGDILSPSQPFPNQPHYDPRLNVPSVPPLPYPVTPTDTNMQSNQYPQGAWVNSDFPASNVNPTPPGVSPNYPGAYPALGQQQHPSNLMSPMVAPEMPMSYPTQNQSFGAPMMSGPGQQQHPSNLMSPIGAPAMPISYPAQNQSFGAPIMSGPAPSFGVQPVPTFQQQFMSPIPQSNSPQLARNQGTVQPAANFNAQEDAAVLHRAMKGFGCDNNAVISIVCQRTNKQRQDIRRVFLNSYGQDLIERLVSKLRFNFEKVIVALMYTPAEFDSRELYRAMKGLGTNESVLIEIMATRTNAEVAAIKETYRAMYGKELVTFLTGDTSGHFRRLMKSLCVASRDESCSVNPAAAAQQAQQLYAAGAKHWGTDESQFNATLVMTNPRQLQVVFDEYQRLTGHAIEDAVRSEFSGDIKNGMLALVQCARSKPAFFAARANAAMKGLGTNDRDLIRVIVSRSETDLAQIKREYEATYGESLLKAVRDDTSGSYREALSTIIGS